MVTHVGCGNVNTPPEWSPCCWPDCEGLAEGGGPPLCESHYQQVGRQYAIEVRQAQAEMLGPLPTHREHMANRSAGLAAQSQVYYLRIGDHVKIGFSNNMRKRLGDLRLDDDALLATEPGGRMLEGQRHRQFAAERVGRRENFNPSPRLLAHIERVKAEHGPPTMTTYKSWVDA